MVGSFLKIGHNKTHLNTGYTTIKGYVEKSKVKKYQELYELNKNNKLEDNTTAYLTPLSEFPPYKLKNYIEENKLNIKTARKLDKIDTLIINHDFVASSYTKKLINYYIVPPEVILKDSYFKKYINNSSNYYKIDEVAGEKITHYFVSNEDYNDLVNLDSKLSIISTYPLIECTLVTNDWGNKKAADNTNFFLNMFDMVENYNLKIIFDHNISDVVNEGLTIDEDVFENILNMVTSQDESNLDLAKEILANMEFESSRSYLIYLFNYFYKLNQNRSNNKNYNYLKKQMKKHVYIHSTQNNPTTFNHFLLTLIGKYPELSQDFMNCFRIHMNLMLKRNVIKEIQTY
jgi:hypothetical protein